MPRLIKTLAKVRKNIQRSVGVNVFCLLLTLAYLAKKILLLTFAAVFSLNESKHE
jgi:hypothetical protein